MKSVHLAPFEGKVLHVWSELYQDTSKEYIDALQILWKGRDVFNHAWTSNERTIDAALGRLRKKGLAERYLRANGRSWSYWMLTDAGREFLGFPALQTA